MGTVERPAARGARESLEQNPNPVYSKQAGVGGGLGVDGPPVKCFLSACYSSKILSATLRVPVYENDSPSCHHLFPLSGSGISLENCQARGSVMVRSSSVDGGNTGIQLQFESALCKLSRVWFCPVPVRRLNPAGLPCFNPNFLVPSRLYLLYSLDYRPLPIC